LFYDRDRNLPRVMFTVSFTRLFHVNAVLFTTFIVCRLSPDDQGGRMDWGLGDETIGSRKT
jgi:hypothetical protein